MKSKQLLKLFECHYAAYDNFFENGIFMKSSKMTIFRRNFLCQLLWLKFFFSSAFFICWNIFWPQNQEWQRKKTGTLKLRKNKKYDFLSKNWSSLVGSSFVIFGFGIKNVFQKSSWKLPTSRKISLNVMLKFLKYES